MAADDTSGSDDMSLGLDASSAFNSLGQLQAAFDSLSTKVENAAAKFAKHAKGTDELTKKFEALHSSGLQLNATFKGTKEEFEQVWSKLSFATEASNSFGKSLKDLHGDTEAQTKKLRELGSAIEEYNLRAQLSPKSSTSSAIPTGVTDDRKNQLAATMTESNKDLQERLALLGQEVNLENVLVQREMQALMASGQENQAKAKIDQLLADQEALMAKLVEQNKEDLRLLKEQEEASKRFNALREKAVRDNEKAEVAEQRRLGKMQEQERLAQEEMRSVMALGDQVKHEADRENEVNARLRQDLDLRRQIERQAKEANRADATATGNKLLTQTAGFRGLGTEDRAKIAAEIAKINQLIASGAIQSKRAEEIVKSVLAGEVAIYEGAEARLERIARRIGTINGDLRQGMPTNDILNSAKQLQSGFEKTGEEGERAAHRIIIGWREAARLVAVQLLHTAIRGFIDSIKQSAEEAANFEIRVSEIRTISQNSAVSFNEWAESARRLSDQFGNPILDVTEGLYQALSSQLVKGAEASDLVAKSLEFSRVTMASTADSVYLLSSALNSYGLTAADTDRVQSVLFKTITLGHLRAEDLARTFGRTGPFAHQLGISIEEVGASIATLTRNGLPANEAMVLMNNLLTHLVKPSKAMKDLFEEWGVTSGEAAIQIFGFTGVLEKLNIATRGSSEEIAKLFPELRSLRAEISLGSHLEEVKNNFADIKKNVEEFHKAVSITFESSGAQVKKQMNQIHNYIVTGFGEAALSKILSLGHAIGGDGGLLGAFKRVENLVVLAGGAFIAYKTASALATVATQISTAWQTAESQALSLSTASRTTYNTSLEFNKAAYVDLAKAAELAAAGHYAEAKAAETSAAASFEAAAAARAEAVSLTTMSTAARFGTNALAGIGAMFTSPVFLLTVAIGAVVYYLNYLREVEEKHRNMVKAAADDAVDFSHKLTQGLDKSLSDQDELWKKALAKRFVDFAEFGGNLSSQIRQIADAEIEATKEATDAAKASIQEFIKSAESDLKKLEKDRDEAINNIRDAEKDAARDSERSQEKLFQRKMQLAEHLDRMATPGKDMKLFDENQLKLVNDELARLQKVQADLSAVKIDDPKMAHAHLEDLQKNYGQQEKIETDLYTRRLKLEEERKNLAKQVSDEQKRITDKEASDAAKRKEIALKDDEVHNRRDARADRLNNKGKELSPFAKKGDIIKDEEKKTRDEETLRHDAEQLKQEKESLDALKARLKALDDSLKLMPQINDFEKTFGEIQKKNNDALKEYFDIQKKARDEAAKKLEDDKQNFIKLRTVLLEIEKFKFEKTDIKETMSEEHAKDALQKRLDAFDKLEQRARDAGLSDQSVLDRLMEQRVHLEKEGQAKIEQLQAKHATERVNQIRNEMEATQAKLIETVKTATTKITDLTLPKILGVTGRPATVDEKTGKLIGHPGAIDAAFQRFHVDFGDARNRMNHPFERALGMDPSAMRRLLRQQLEAVEATKTGAPLDTSATIKLQAEIAKWQTLSAKLIVFQPGFTTSKMAMGDMPVEVGRKNEAGQALSDVTFAQEMANLKKWTDELLAQAKEREDAVKTQKDQDDRLKAELDKMDKLGISHDKLTASATAASQGFDALTKELAVLIGSMQRLKDVIDTKTGAPPAVRKSFGGLVGDDFRSFGTDTVPAMLSPKEFVMNSASTQKFLPELNRMNLYGQMSFNPNNMQYQPKVTVQKAHASNVAFHGDIVINQHLSGTQRPDPRQMVKDIQRELRLTGISLVREHDD